MNRIFTFLILIIFSGITMNSFGQSKADKALQKNIIGTWKYKGLKFEVGDQATDEEKAVVQMAEMLTEQFTDITYKFEKNGQYTQGQQDMVEKGTWKIKNEILTMTKEDGTGNGEAEMLISIDKDTLSILSKISAGLSSKLILEKK
jgi:Lipocalin-like domain